MMLPIADTVSNIVVFFRILMRAALDGCVIYEY